MNNLLIQIKMLGCCYPLGEIPGKKGCRLGLSGIDHPRSVPEAWITRRFLGWKLGQREQAKDGTRGPKPSKTRLDSGRICFQVKT